jgi:translation initiation factor 2 subunit 3
MEFQPVINIGMLGHVSDGKTTITKQLTGTLTQKHSSEKQKNLTIRLGYANAKICKCLSCPKPTCYFSVSSDIFVYKCPNCDSDAKLMNHVSFVDCPGHNMLMSTMLNGTSVMDYVMFVESTSNQNIPAPQTLEHFNCIKNMNIKNIATIINKIDLVNKQKAIDICIILQKFLDENHCASPIIPVSATHKINMDVLCMILANLPIPQRNMDLIKMPIIRSFNINKPGTKIDDLNGGVCGGSIQSGKIKIDDELFLIPGMIMTDDNKNYIFKPIKCKVESINSEKNNLNEACSGGLIGIKMNIDPGLTADDGLIGNVLSDKITGVVTKNFELKLNQKLSKKNKYIFNINSNNINGKFVYSKDNIYEVLLDNHQYINDGDIITISINNGININLLDYCKFNMNLNYAKINMI